ncbi:MAG: hypothetical protein EPO61_09650 [Nitrospirae bacterium]|nr:MAG: hypothetical protein EPO61_09650 [Nitrospirota bacterium]
MPIPQHAIDRLAPSIQPLIFETGVEYAPYSSTRGTVFLVGYEGKPYVITARHALQPDNLVPICIFPSDISHQLIPLKDVFYVPRSLEDDDFVDLAVIAIDTNRITHPEVARARLIDLALSCGEWKRYASEAQFFVLGYPEERSIFNYETQEFRADRMILLGHYRGLSRPPYLHLLSVLDNLSLKTFSGLSGAPVFAWVELPMQRPRPILCGMVLRGNPESGLIHFLDRDMLLDALQIKRQHEQ